MSGGSSSTVHSKISWANNPAELSMIHSRTTRRPSVSSVPRQITTTYMRNQVRKISGHKCDLPLTEDRIHYVITNGLFVLLRRKFRKWLSVCPSDPDSKKFLKSSFQMHVEETRQFTRHFYMIHPFSKGRFVWEMLMIPVLSMLFCLIPLELATDEVPWYRLIWKLILDMVSIIDIILFFFTGYYDIDRNVVVMNATQVAKRYLCTFFLFDVASSIPYTFLMKIFVAETAEYSQKLHASKLLLLLKLVRMPTLTRYLSKFSIRMNFWGYYIKFVNFMLWVYVLIVWTTCVIYGMFIHISEELHNKDEEIVTHMESSLVPILMTVYDVVRAFMSVGVSDTPNISTFAVIVEILALLFGSALNVVILAKVVQVFQRKIGSKNKYTSLTKELNEYMKYKELPTRLQEKVFNYVDFKFQRHIFKEDDILHTLSPKLKQDILMHSCQTMIKTVEFFKDLPTTVMLRLVTRLRSEIYLPNDVIVTAGYSGNAMYFIYTGTVAIYTRNGKEICHLDDGGHFGEIALVFNEPRVATVVAIRECEVFEPQRFPRSHRTVPRTQQENSRAGYDENGKNC